MATDVANLQLKIDSSDAGAASAALDRLVAASERTATAVESMGKKTKESTETAQQSTKSLVDQFNDQLVGAIQNVQKYFTGLAIAFAAGWSFSVFKDLISSAIEAQAHMADLSLKTGASVEALSKIGPVAKLSGTSIDDVGFAITKLSRGMAGADEETKGAGRALEFLGISAKDSNGNLKDAGDLYIEVAQAMSQYQDGAGKVALAMDLFGRSGANQLRVMKDLGDASNLDAKLTTAQAEAAETLERNYNKLGKTKGQIAKIIATELVPVMNDLLKVFLDSTSGSGGLKDAIAGLAKDGTLQLWARAVALAMGYVFDMFMNVVRACEVVVFGIIAVAKAMAGNIDGAMEYGRKIGEVFDAANKPGAVDKLIAAFDKTDKKARDAATAQGMMQAAIATGDPILMAEAQHLYDVATASEEAEKKTTDYSTSVDKASKAGEQYLARLEEEYATMGMTKTQADIYKASKMDLTDAEKQHAYAIIASVNGYKDGKEKLDELNKTFKSYQDNLNKQLALDPKATELEKTLYETASGSLKDLSQAQKDVLIQKAAYIDQQKDEQKATDDLNKYRTDHVKSLIEEGKKLDELLKNEKDNLDKMGLTKVQLDNLITKRYEDARATVAQKLASEGLSDYEYGFYTRQLKEWDDIIAVRKQAGNRQQEIDAAAASEKAAKEADRQWLKTAEDINNKLTDALMDVFKNKGKGFADEFRDYLKKTFDGLVLKPLIQMAMAPASGALASMVPGLGQNASPFTSGGVGGIGQASGLTGLLGGGSGATLGSSIAYSGVGEALGLSAPTTSLVATGGLELTSLGASFAAALPVVGWVIGAGALAYSILGSKGGGPKTGGSAFSGVGGLPSDRGIGSQAFYTPSDADQQLQQATAGIGTSYLAAVAGLGGRAGGFRFGMGADYDPSGTASNRLGVSVTDASGRQLYGYRDKDMGRDSETIKAQMQVEAQRMLLAALQASDLPENVSKVLNKAVPDTLSGDQIQGMIAFGTAVKGLGDLIEMDPVGGFMKSLEDSQKTLMDVYDEQTASVTNLTTTMDGSIDSVNQLSDATHERYKTEIALMKEITDSIKSIHTSFAGTKESMLMDTLTSGQQLDYLQNKKLGLMSSLAGETDPTKVAADAQQLRDIIQQMWGLLSGPEKTAQLKDYQDLLDKIEKDSTDKLNAAKDKLKSDNDALHDTIKDAISTAIEKFNPVVDKFSASVDKQSNLKVDVNVDVTGPGTATSQVYQT